MYDWCIESRLVSDPGDEVSHLTMLFDGLKDLCYFSLGCLRLRESWKISDTFIPNSGKKIISLEIRFEDFRKSSKNSELGKSDFGDFRNFSDKFTVLKN